MKFQYILILCLSVFVSQAHAAFKLPRKLTADDRVRATEILAAGAAPKILGNPYPLGGYSGIEIGLSMEFIPTEDLADLGDKSSDKESFGYSALTLGKGLYHNVDTFVYFTPFNQTSEIQAYGGQLRWAFFESSQFPVALSAVLYAGGANFANLINTTSFGGDLVGTVSVENIAVYMGMGQLRSNARFIGGVNGITVEETTFEQSASLTHSFVGVSVSVSGFFLAGELNRYVDSFYSGKIGYRF